MNASSQDRSGHLESWFPVDFSCLFCVISVTPTFRTPPYKWYGEESIKFLELQEAPFTPGPSPLSFFRPSDPFLGSLSLAHPKSCPRTEVGAPKSPDEAGTEEKLPGGFGALSPALVPCFWCQEQELSSCSTLGRSFPALLPVRHDPCESPPDVFCGFSAPLVWFFFYYFLLISPFFCCCFFVRLFFFSHFLFSLFVLFFCMCSFVKQTRGTVSRSSSVSSVNSP